MVVVVVALVDDVVGEVVEGDVVGEDEVEDGEDLIPLRDFDVVVVVVVPLLEVESEEELAIIASISSNPPLGDAVC